MLHPYYYARRCYYYYYCSHYDHTLMMMMIILHYSRFPLPARTPSEMLLCMYNTICIQFVLYQIHFPYPLFHYFVPYRALLHARSKIGKRS